MGLEKWAFVLGLGKLVWKMGCKAARVTIFQKKSPVKYNSK